MKYKDVKRRLKEGKEFTFKEVQEWVKYVSQPKSYRDFFNGKHISRQLLIKYFDNIVSGLLEEELVELKDYLFSMPVLAHKENQILLKKLKEQVNKEQVINSSILRACLNIAYGKDKEREPVEDVNNMKHYIEQNFGKVIKKNLFPNFSDAYGVFLAKPLREHKKFRDDILQTLIENVKLYGKNLYNKDFRWFTSFLHEFDPDYLIEHSTEFIDILPASEIDFYLGILGENPNIEESSKILSENAETFIRETPAPLTTWKKIKELDNSFGLKSSIDNELLDEIMNKRVCDITKKISHGVLSKKEEESLAMLITDIADSEDCKIGDIKKIGSGAYQNAYKIGNKVLKIGKKPFQYRIPKNHKRFLQPIVRSEQIITR